MKNSLICFLVILSIMITISATAQEKFSLGFTAGANYTTINAKNDSQPPFQSFILGDPEFHSGLKGGITTNYYFNNRLGVLVEFLYSEKGYRLSSDNSMRISNSHIRHQYFNIPILLRYQPIEQLNLNGGIEFGHLLSAKSKTENETIDLKKLDLYNDFDFGLVIGIGANITPKLSLDLRYIHGLSGILQPVTFTDQNGNTIGRNEQISFENRSIQLGISMQLIQN